MDPCGGLLFEQRAREGGCLKVGSAEKSFSFNLTQGGCPSEENISEGVSGQGLGKKRRQTERLASRAPKAKQKEWSEKENSRGVGRQRQDEWHSWLLQRDVTINL